MGGAVPEGDPAESAADDRDLVILSTPANEAVTDVHTDRLRQGARGDVTASGANRSATHARSIRTRRPHHAASLAFMSGRFGNARHYKGEAHGDCGRRKGQKENDPKIGHLRPCGSYLYKARFPNKARFPISSRTRNAPMVGRRIASNKYVRE